MNRLNKTLLGNIHFAVLNYSRIMSVNSIPENLNSLSLENPTEDELWADYAKMSKEFKHPIFIDFIPTYEESSKCLSSAWYKRYIKVYQMTQEYYFIK